MNWSIIPIDDAAGAPVPNGHYAQAVLCGPLMFLSLQLPIDPLADGALVAGLEAQTLQVVRNIEAVLARAGGALGNVVSVTVFVSDIRDWPTIDRAFASAFGCHRPARGVVASAKLHLGALVGMQAIAALPSTATASARDPD